MRLKLLLIFLVRSTSALPLNLSEKIAFPRLINNVDFTENQLCKSQSKLYQDHLKNLTLWAHEMWDASAKSSTGVLRGNLFQMGDWDECITVDAPYKTQYCLVVLGADIPEPQPPRDDALSLYYPPFDSMLNRLYKTEEVSMVSRDAVHLGLCVPASCTLEDLQDSFNKQLQSEFFENELNLTYNVEVSSDKCQTIDDINYFDSWDVTFCVILFILILLVVLSTIYDYVQSEEKDMHKEPNKPTMLNKLCLAFSVRKNFKDLPKADESNPALSVLYGLKTVSIFMIIMDHRFGTFLSGPIINTDYIEREYRSKATSLIFHGDLFVDTFFILSGLLVTYGLLVQYNKKIVNPFFIIFLRYIRLTPAYAFVILYWASMLNHTGSGPLWKTIIKPEVEDCRKNGWSNLLYINNYYNDSHSCMTHSWYLPCDFHFFIIAIFLVLLIKKRKKLGVGALVAFLVISIIIPFAITIIYLRPALLQFYLPTLKDVKNNIDFRLIYTKSHIRATSYVMGMIGGYIYFKQKESPAYLSKTVSHCLTLISFLILLGVVGTGAIFYDRYHEYDVIESAFYAALHRVGWGAGTIGLLLAASYGHAKILYSVLSWSPWISLGKLVYGAYLIHMSFQLRSVAMTITPKYFTYFDVVGLAVADIVLAFTYALFLYLGIEAPFRKIFKELLTPSRGFASKPSGETHSSNPNQDSHL